MPYLGGFQISGAHCGYFPRGGHTMLITLFTSIPALRTALDLEVFPSAGDDVFFLAGKG